MLRFPFTPIMPRRAGAALVIAALASACSDSTVAGPSATRELQRVVDSLALAAHVPGVVVAVQRAGQAPTVVASGVADLATGRKLTAADRFRIGSLTKPMVATIVLQLADEGRLALDDPIARLLPGVLADADRITIRQLLNHTSGLPSYTDDTTFIAAIYADPARRWTPQELVSIARGMPRSFAPGAAGQWAYSNTNYILLGLVAEAAGGQPLATLLKTRVFDRLGMTQTYYSTEPALNAPFAEGYADLDAATRDVPVGTRVSPTWAGAAGAVVSTAADVARFAEALADGRLVSPAAQAARLTTIAASRYRFPGDSFDSEYGLGVLVGGGWVGHNGAIPGYEAEAQAKAGTGSVVVLVNRTTDDFVAQLIAAAIRTRIFGPQ